MRHSWGISEISYFLQRWWLSYFGSKEQIQARPDVFRALLVFFKLVGIFVISGLGFWIMFWPSAWVFFCTWVPNLMPQQANDAIWGFWGILYQLLMGAAGCVFLTIVISQVTLLKDINGEKVSWTTYARLLFDFVAYSTFTQLMFSGYPTYVCATRLFWTDRFVYVVAAKPNEKPNEKEIAESDKSSRQEMKHLIDGPK